MDIWLYNCTAENNRVNKSDYISNAFNIQGSLRNPSDVINPTIIIEKTNPAGSLYNYAYITEFRRWYYINNWRSINTNIWELTAHVDVLMTWGAQIKANKAIISRTEDFNNANMYIDDGAFVMDSRKNNTIIEYPLGLDNNGQFILICAGGNSSSVN